MSAHHALYDTTRSANVEYASPANVAAPTVEIYERSDLMRGLLEAWLTQAGYCVRQPGVSKSVGLVIVGVDVARQQASGVVRTMRIFYPTTPFIVLSNRALAGASADSAARMLGVARVLSKPLIRSELVQVVHGLIGGMNGSRSEV